MEPPFVDTMPVIAHWCHCDNLYIRGQPSLPPTLSCRFVADSNDDQILQYGNPVTIVSTTPRTSLSLPGTKYRIIRRTCTVCNTVCPTTEKQCDSKARVLVLQQQIHKKQEGTASCAMLLIWTVVAARIEVPSCCHT